MSEAAGERVDGDNAVREKVDQLSIGYAFSSILFAAVELGLFDGLVEGACNTDELARRIGASRTGVARLASALAAQGLLHRDLDGRFSASPSIVRLLATKGDDSLVPVLRYHQRHIAPLMASLAESVRSGRPQHASWPFASPGAEGRHSYEELARHPAEYELFLDALDRLGMGTGTAIAASYDLRGARRLIDLAGGGGRIAREILAAAPDLTIEMIDLPIACKMAEEKAKVAGVSSRFRATPGDLRKPLGGATLPGDVVLLSGVLADFSPEDRSQILANAAALLRPGAALLVSETLLDESRTSPMLPVLLSLVMLVAMPGDSFTLAELSSILRNAGFSRLEHRAPAEAGKRDLLVARR